MPSQLNVDSIRPNTSGGAVTFPDKPHVSVEFSAGTSTYLSHTNEAVKFDNVLEGDASLYNTSTYKFTCPVAGLYLASFHLLVQTAQNIDILLYRNSTMQNRTYVSSEQGIGSAYVVVCSANDELYWYVGGTKAFYEHNGNNRYSWGTYTFLG